MLSVRIYFAAILSISLTSFYFDTASPQGDWQCMTKSAQADEHTWYQINCICDLHLENDGLVLSSCVEPFSPTGSKWQTRGNLLVLTDSEGTVFSEYEWEMPDDRTLILKNESATYTFDKIYKPRAAGN